MQPRDGHRYFVLVCGSFETVTVTGARLYVLAVIEHASRGSGSPGRLLHHCMLGCPGREEPRHGS